MTYPRAVIISHGQPSDAAVAERELCALARRVAALAPGWDIRSATLAAPLSVAMALHDAPGTTLVYPLFMADGWFTRVALPRRLGSSSAQVLPPFGCDAALPPLAARTLRRVLQDRGWAPETTRLFIAGHGSGRSARPAEVTQAFGAALSRTLPLAKVRCGFVEQAPFLAEAADGLGQHALCLPFFAAKRGHVLDDLPQALDAVGFEGVRLDPIGLWPEVPSLIAETLQAARSAAA